jgi:hypothetical protein
LTYNAINTCTPPKSLMRMRQEAFRRPFSG